MKDTRSNLERSGAELPKPSTHPDRPYVVGGGVWVVKWMAIKMYHVFPAMIEGANFDPEKGFQYILSIGGPTDIKDIFGTYEEAITEAEKRWAFDKENSPIIPAPTNGKITLPGQMFS